MITKNLYNTNIGEQKRLNNFSEKAPIIEIIILNTPKKNKIGCQINFKCSNTVKNKLINKKIIVNFENTDKKVIVGKGDPP